MNCLWTLVWLMNLSTYRPYSDEPVPHNHEVLFQITRHGRKMKRHMVASYNQTTGIYFFNDKHFVSLNDMLSYVLTI